MGRNFNFIAALSLVVVGVSVFGAIPSQKKTTRVKTVAIHKKKAASAASKELAKASIPKQEAPAKTLPAATATKVSATASPQGTTSVSVSAVEPKAAKKRFAFKWRSYNAMDLSNVENSVSVEKADQEVRSWNRINLTYKPTDSIALSLMPQFYNTWFGVRDRAQDPDKAGLNQSYSFYLGNTALILSHSSLAKLKGDVVIDGLIRYDAPTSEISQKADSFGEAWAGAGVSKSFGPVDTKLTLLGRYYLNQYETSQLKDSKDLPFQNNDYKIYTLLDFDGNVTKKFTASLSLGYVNAVSLPDSNTGRIAKLSDVVMFSPSITYTFSDQFNLSGGLYEEVNMRTRTSTYVPLDVANGGEVFVQSTLSF